MMDDDVLASFSAACAGGGWDEDPNRKLTIRERLAIGLLVVIALGAIASLFLVVLGVVK